MSTPIKLKFALVHYYSADPSGELDDQYWSEAGIETRKWLKDEGLVDDRGAATERLVVWIKHLCAQPLPVQTWKMPE